MRMAWNILVAWLISLIPVLGDIFNVGFKANSKNVRIIMTHVESQLDADVIAGDFERVA